MRLYPARLLDSSDLETWLPARGKRQRHQGCLGDMERETFLVKSLASFSGESEIVVSVVVGDEPATTVVSANKYGWSWLDDSGTDIGCVGAASPSRRDEGDVA
jgi:hypothetical protein